MKSERTDEDLIRLYYPSQPRYCFDILYRRYYQTIYHQCLWLTRHPEKAQDYSQDVFIKVFQKLGTFQQRSRFATAQLNDLAHNFCRDQIRRSERLSTSAINAQLEMSLIDQTETCCSRRELASLVAPWRVFQSPSKPCCDSSMSRH